MDDIEFALAWMAAIVANATAAIGNYMADEWIIVGSDGATAKAEFLAMVLSGDLTRSVFCSLGRRGMERLRWLRQLQRR